jgi:hypothetical protein
MVAYGPNEWVDLERSTQPLGSDDYDDAFVQAYRLVHDHYNRVYKSPRPVAWGAAGAPEYVRVWDSKLDMTVAGWYRGSLKFDANSQT